MFCLDFSIFLHAREFIYDKWEKIFPNFAFIHFSISFEKDDNLILILSISKMNYFHKEVCISLITIINELSIYLIIILHTLFNHFSVSLKISLFTKIFDSFSRDHLIKIIRNILFDTDFNSIDFSNYSLRRDAIISIIAIDIP